MWCAAVDRSGQKVQHVQLTNCIWRSGNNARKGLMHCCRRSCCPRRSCYHFIQLHGLKNQYMVVVINYGLVRWWLELCEVVLPSPHEIENSWFTSKSIRHR